MENIGVDLNELLMIEHDVLYAHLQEWSDPTDTTSDEIKYGTINGVVQYTNIVASYLNNKNNQLVESAE